MRNFGYNIIRPQQKKAYAKAYATRHKVTPRDVQTHSHEFLGSTMLAGPSGLIHNHRFAGVTSEEIPSGESHIHGFLVNTDFVFEHLHEISGLTGPAVGVGMGRHVHFAEAVSTLNLGHVHDLIFATLIDSPIG